MCLGEVNIVYKFITLTIRTVASSFGPWAGDRVTHQAALQGMDLINGQPLVPGDPAWSMVVLLMGNIWRKSYGNS
jgi:hypothetical protein